MELADSLDSGSSVHSGRAGSSPASPTKIKNPETIIVSGFSLYFQCISDVSRLQHFTVCAQHFAKMRHIFKIKLPIKLPITMSAFISFLLLFQYIFSTLHILPSKYSHISRQMRLFSHLPAAFTYIVSVWLLDFNLCSGLIHDGRLMRFLFVRLRVCLQLPSDPTSRWTPLLFSYALPTTGRARDFHPLDFAHTGRTTKRPRAHKARERFRFFRYFCISSNSLCSMTAISSRVSVSPHAKSSLPSAP